MQSPQPPASRTRGVVSINSSGSQPVALQQRACSNSASTLCVLQTLTRVGMQSTGLEGEGGRGSALGDLASGDPGPASHSWEEESPASAVSQLLLPFLFWDLIPFPLVRL